MSWLQFFLGVSGAYLIYYLANIGFDLYLSGPHADEEAWTEELIFSEPVVPVSFTDHDPPQVTTGGVSLKDLFALARAEAIVYTRPVSF